MKNRTFKQKLKLRLKGFFPWAYKAWERVHNWRQFSKTMRAFDYHATVFFNRKLAREIQEVNDKMIYESRMSRIRADVSSVTVEQFVRDYEKMMPELLLLVMQKASKLEIELDGRIRCISEDIVNEYRNRK